MAILLEEVGEVYIETLKESSKGIEEELIHVAAVCVAWLEKIKENRNENRE